MNLTYTGQVISFKHMQIIRGKTLALPSTPWCAWPLTDKLGEVSATILCRPRVHDDDEMMRGSTCESY